jgi:hypothetical protein
MEIINYVNIYITGRKAVDNTYNRTKGSGYHMHNYFSRSWNIRYLQPISFCTFLRMIRVKQRMLMPTLKCRTSITEGAKNNSTSRDPRSAAEEKWWTQKQCLVMAAEARKLPHHYEPWQRRKKTANNSQQFLLLVGC